VLSCHCRLIQLHHLCDMWMVWSQAGHAQKSPDTVRVVMAYRVMSLRGPRSHVTQATLRALQDWVHRSPNCLHFCVPSSGRMREFALGAVSGVPS